MEAMTTQRPSPLPTPYGWTIQRCNQEPGGAVAELVRQREVLKEVLLLLQGALIESNKLGYTPEQQGSIARNALVTADRRLAR